MTQKGYFHFMHLFYIYILFCVFVFVNWNRPDITALFDWA